MRPVDDRENSAHILLVDDSPADLKLLVQELDKKAYRLTVAMNGRQAYARAQALPRPDLILLDVCMPQLDGYATCTLLKENPQTAHIPIIFVTASSHLDERLRGFQSGAADYVLKPYNPVEVLARIRVHLSKPSSAAADAAFAHAGRTEAANAPACARENPGLMPDMDIQLPAPMSNATDQAIVATTRRYLQENLANPPSLKSLARQIGVHERRLTQAFRILLGKSVKDYLRDERMHSAQKLLHLKQLSISEIAETLGFSSPANFAAAFRRHAGCSPVIFRQQLQGELRPLDEQNRCPPMSQ
ncbi:response regulator transcription factor [Achromobacter aloeverae]|uniref:DNA-binding response regulator n=1 Tax=Achromobacter aloeverae TaxID=1750518 RepID=A0A4V1MS02_9BURK|nr:response regulator [Achromobacter aloeverae]RXN87770.1 DNA-binding response regulator [Achromobacter aloeverae]